MKAWFASYRAPLSAQANAIETLHQIEIHFGMAHHVTNDDFCRRPRQGEAAAAAAGSLDEALQGKIVHHFHQVIAGDAVSVGNFGDGHGALSLEAEVQQHPQRIISV